MEYQIAVPPDLDVKPAGFVETWNEDPACRAVAEARVAESTAEHYDPALVAGGLAVLGSVALGVASNALYDLIKRVLTRQGVRQQIEIMQLDQPDGSRLLVVKIVEA